MVDNIDNEQALDLEITNNKFVLLDFWAEWCGPCKAFSPTFEEFSKENTNVKCFKVNIDNSQDLAVKYEVRSIPTIILIKGGKVVERKIGMLHKNALQELLKRFNDDN